MQKKYIMPPTQVHKCKSTLKSCLPILKRHHEGGKNIYRRRKVGYICCRKHTVKIATKKAAENTPSK